MLKGYRTLIFNVVALVAAACGYTALPEETIAQYTDAIILVGGGMITVGNIVLRMITTGPVFAGKKPDSTTLHGIAALALIGIGLMTAGCASRFGETDLQKMAGIEKDFTLLQEQILTLFDSGVLPDEAKSYVKKLEAAAYQAKEKAWEAALAGDSMKTAAAISLAKSAVAEALSYIKQSNWLQSLKSKATASTGPPPFALVARVPLTVLED